MRQIQIGPREDRVILRIQALLKGKYGRHVSYAETITRVFDALIEDLEEFAEGLEMEVQEMAR